MVEAMPTLITVAGRLSETTGRDLAGAEATAAAAARRWPGATQVDCAGARGDATVVRGADGWREALATSEPLLRAAGRAVEATLRAGGWPLTFASDCALALATLPGAARAEPDVHVLWLDAHYDFSLPAPEQTWLGGLALSGATGQWPSPFGAPLDPARVVLLGPRSDAGASPEAAPRAGVGVVPATSDGVASALGVLAGRPVYVHLDPDVLDPGEYAGEFPEPQGPSLAWVAAALREVAAAARVVGAEVTAIHAPDDADGRRRLAEALVTCLDPAVPAGV